MPLINILPYKSQRSEPLENMVLAMDFEGNDWVDFINPTRSFGVTGSGTVSRSTAMRINGTQSFKQDQIYTSPAGLLYTPRTPDLTFAGDFWIEFWAYCLGQGNRDYTGGSNYLISYGRYAATGLASFWLDNLKPTFSIPSGTANTTIAQSQVQIINYNWHHYALGRKDGVVRIFLDGKVVASANYADMWGFDDRFCIGGYQDSRIGNSTYAGVNGYMDRLRVYNGRCLSITDFTPATSQF